MGLGQEEGVSRTAEVAAAAAGAVLLTLASAQFLMTLDRNNSVPCTGSEAM
jgi:hypothetical protein